MKKKTLIISIAIAVIIVAGIIVYSILSKPAVEPVAEPVETEVTETETETQTTTAPTEPQTTTEPTEPQDTTAPVIKELSEVPTFDIETTIKPSEVCTVEDSSSYRVYFLAEDGETDTLQFPAEVGKEVYVTVQAEDEFGNKSEELTVLINLNIPQQVENPKAETPAVENPKVETPAVETPAQQSDVPVPGTEYHGMIVEDTSWDEYGFE